MQKLENFSLKSDSLVQATAGAGKTTRLISDVYETYLYHKHKFGTWPKILLTTFTVKAANELSERLMLKAQELNDFDFLSYSVSYNLEVGTMHSVFAKLISLYKEDEGVEGMQAKYISASLKKKFSQALVVQIIQEKNWMHHFLDEYLFNEMNDLFLLMNHEATEEPELYSYQELLESSKSYLDVLLNDLNEPSTDNFGIESFEDLKRVYAKIKETKYEKEDKKVAKKILDFLSEDGNKEENILIFLEKNKIVSELYKIWNIEFNKKVKELNFYVLEDMEALFLSLVKGKDVDKIWDYCFFDEYQDTNPLQKEIIDTIAKPSIKYFVGDPFQSIYYFRGARKEIFDSEQKRIKNQTGNITYRTTNYRSDRNIINFTNALCSDLFDDFHAMEPTKEENGDVKIVFFEQDEDQKEYEYIYSQIKNLNFNNTAILSKNTKSLLKCAQYLKDKGVPVNASFGNNFEQSLEVLELVNLLRFIKNTSDEKYLIHLLRSEWFYIEDRKIKIFIEEAKNNNQTLWEKIKFEKEVLYLNEILKNSQPLSLAIKEFFKVTDFLNFTDKKDDSGLREYNVWKFVHALEKEEIKDDFNVFAFCDDVESGKYPFGKERPEQEKGCQLLTVHGSKGLQYENVFIINANARYYDGDQTRAFYFNEKTKKFALKSKSTNGVSNVFPHDVYKSAETPKFIKHEEDKRLLYVACTRAQKRLFIVGSGKKEKAPQAPSWMTHVLRTIETQDIDVSVVNEISSVVDKSDSNDVSKNYGFFLNKQDIFLDIETLLAPSESEDLIPTVEKHKNPLDYSQAIAKGVLFHFYMEGVNIENENFDMGLKYLKEQNDFPFQEIWKEGYREWGYDYFVVEKGVIESGKVDLWAKIGNTVWIVDYKTGTTSQREKGFVQLERYMAVLKEYLKDEKLIYNLVLTFPLEKKTWIRKESESYPPES